MIYDAESDLIAKTIMGWVAAAEKAALPVTVPFEAAVRSAMGSQNTALIDGWLKANQDPLSKGLPLMNPFNVLLVILMYFAVIVLGRVLMAPMKAFSAKGLSFVHNVILVLLSAYMCQGAIRGAINNKFNLWGNGIDADQGALARVIWVFYVSKIPEFVDTFIMVLKKNHRQISFLHVYHHSTIFPIWWWITYQFPGGDSYFSCAQNSFIHVIMYSYYLARTVGINVPAPMKFMVTNGQMFQFLLNLFQAVYVIVFTTNYPKAPAILLLVYMVSLLALFGNFNRQQKAAHRAEQQKGGQQPKKSAQKTKSS